MFAVASHAYIERSIYDELIDLDKDGETNGAYSQPDDVPVRPASIYRGLDEPANDETYTKPDAVPAVPPAPKIYHQLDSPAATSNRDSELDNDMYIHPHSEHQDKPTVTPIRNEEALHMIDNDMYIRTNSKHPDEPRVTRI